MKSCVCLCVSSCVLQILHPLYCSLTIFVMPGLWFSSCWLLHHGYEAMWSLKTMRWYWITADRVFWWPKTVFQLTLRSFIHCHSVSPPLLSPIDLILSLNSSCEESQSQMYQFGKIRGLSKTIFLGKNCLLSTVTPQNEFNRCAHVQHFWSSLFADS